MNEIEFIRLQIATERRHFNAVKGALAEINARGTADEALMRFCECCVAYMTFVARRIHAQDQAHVESLRARLPAHALSDRQALREFEQALRAHSAATEMLAGQSARALSASPRDVAGLLRACHDYVNLPGAGLRSDTQSIYHLCNEYYTVKDWRQVSFVTADSILQERTLYAGVRATAPAGVTLEN